MKEVFSNSNTFAALKEDGNVVTWGRNSYSGDAANLTNVKEVFSTQEAFAALKEDGSVVTWGSGMYGGNPASEYYGVICGDATRGNDLSCLSGVKEIFSNGSAFAALKADGSVVTWGDSTPGGDSRPVSSKLVKVVKIAATERAFAAHTSDGSVVVWGTNSYGGDLKDSDYGVDCNGDGTKGDDECLSSGIVEIVGTYRNFAAMKEDGTVYTWGYGFY